MGAAIRRVICGVLLLAGCWQTAAQPVVSMNDTQVVEGDSGTTNAEFVITLSEPCTNDITISYQTFEYPTSFYQPYSATSGVDFIATNGTVTFAAGETNKSVFVQVIGDTINEADEPFGLTLQGPGADYLSARCVILDDDPLEIFMNDSTVVEGPAGQTSYAQFTATIYEATEQVVYCQGGLSEGTATSGEDFINGPITWQFGSGPARTNVFCCTVPIVGDGTNEDDETFFLTPNLGFGRYDTNPQNARGVVFLNQAKCTIVNDDFYLDVQPLSDDRTQVTLFGALDATHVFQSSSDLINWTSFSTNTLGPERQVSVVVTNNANQFYRALRTVHVSQ